MEISLTTPALLFPAISLLMLAYTNRFLTLATIIRGLHDRYKNEANDNLLGQIANLRYRIYLIRNMQIFGVLSLLFCVISMFALFAGWIAGGQWTFRDCVDPDDGFDADLPARIADLGRRVGSIAGGIGRGRKEGVILKSLQGDKSVQKLHSFLLEPIRKLKEVTARGFMFIEWMPLLGS